MKRLLAAGTACVLTVVLVGCAGSLRSDWPRLRLDGRLNPGVGDSIGGIPPGHPADVGDITVCLTSPGRVTITQVTPYRPSGDIEVQAYAVRLNPYLTHSGTFLGDAAQPLSKLGFKQDHVVDVVCGTRSGQALAYELALQLTHPTRTDVSAAGWAIHYRSQGHTGTVTVPYSVTVCTGSVNAPACRRLQR